MGSACQRKVWARALLVPIPLPALCAGVVDDVGLEVSANGAGKGAGVLNAAPLLEFGAGVVGDLIGRSIARASTGRLCYGSHSSGERTIASS
jgi:hypothetical protein